MMWVGRSDSIFTTSSLSAVTVMTPTDARTLLLDEFLSFSSCRHVATSSAVTRVPSEKW